MTKIYLVRHCRSKANDENMFQGQSDSEVSEIGMKQLELLSLRFRNINPDAIYSSPLKRAYMTAEAVNKYHNLPINLNSGFMEIDVGSLENESLEQLAVRYPEVARLWNEQPENCAFPGGESMLELYERVGKAFDAAAEQSRGKTAVIVSHGCAIRAILCRCLFGDIARLRDAPICQNTAVSLLEIDGGGKITTPVLADVSHLTPELVGDPRQYHVKGGDS